MAVDSLEEFLSGIEEDGTHRCVVDSAQVKVSQSTGRAWLIISYVVDDENNELNGEEFTELIEDFSHMTLEDYKESAPSDKRTVRTATRRKVERLESLGVPENATAGFKSWETLIGKRVAVTVETSTATKEDPETGATTKQKYTNIKGVALL